MDQPVVMYANATILVGSIVMIDTSRNNAVIPCTSNARAFAVAPMGSRDAPIPSITANPPEAAEQGDTLELFTVGRTCLCVAGGTITAGALIKSGGATGAGVVCAETAGLHENYVGTALEAAAAGEYFKLLVMPGTLTTET